MTSKKYMKSKIYMKSKKYRLKTRKNGGGRRELRILELPINEEVDEKKIKKAYRTMSRKVHPDKNPGDPEAAAKFRDVANAKDILMGKLNGRGRYIASPSPPMPHASMFPQGFARAPGYQENPPQSPQRPQGFPGSHGHQHEFSGFPEFPRSRPEVPPGYRGFRGFQWYDGDSHNQREEERREEAHREARREEERREEERREEARREEESRDEARTEYLQRLNHMIIATHEGVHHTLLQFIGDHLMNEANRVYPRKTDEILEVERKYYQLLQKQEEQESRNDLYQEQSRQEDIRATMRAQRNRERENEREMRRQAAQMAYNDHIRKHPITNDVWGQANEMYARTLAESILKTPPRSPRSPSSPSSTTSTDSSL